VGYTVCFFNGVGNTYADAINGREALRKVGLPAASVTVSDVYNGEDVDYEVFYNQTQGFIKDIAEVFQQRARELDPSGTLSGSHFYLFWDAVEGHSQVGAPGYTSELMAQNGAYKDFFDKYVDTAVNLAVNALVALFTPPTLQDYTTQQARLDADVAAGRKLVLVAHSQGNVFVNQAYDYVLPKIGGANLVKVAHIAPASPTLRGSYVLANIDLVINGLRLKNGYSTVPDPNVMLLSFGGDISGHELIATYLDSSRPGLAATQTLIGNAIAAISPAPCEVKVLPDLTQNAKANDTIGLSVQLPKPIVDPDAVLRYQWAVSGSAGGMLRDPVTNLVAASFESTSSTATYIASSNAVESLQDTVGVTLVLGNLLDPNAHKNIGSGSAIISFGGNPWVGTWVGSVTSTCGYFSGPLTFTITSTGGNGLYFSYGWGGYSGTYNGTTATSSAGNCVFTINGNTMTGTEADSCQTGTYYKQ
jgi:hypothetical protein